jgi:plastocyanin
MQRRMRLLLALFLVLSLAACGGDDDGGEDSGGGATAGSCPSGSVVIDMVDIKFDPEDATAGVGQEVCWINEDEIDHNAVAESGADFESELFGKGETFTATVDEPGTVEYVCTIHPGMEGTITVER